MSNSSPLYDLSCSKCGILLAKTTEYYISVYCSSCWNNMKTTYLQHIKELTIELSQKETEITDLEDSKADLEDELAESDELVLGGSPDG